MTNLKSSLSISIFRDIADQHSVQNRHSVAFSKAQHQTSKANDEQEVFVIQTKMIILMNKLNYFSMLFIDYYAS
jgi:hypothetical protein